MTDCQHKVLHTVINCDFTQEYHKDIITTYCADCGKKIKEVEVKE